MTKNQMIEAIREKEAKAWETKERNAYLYCPRISVKEMFRWIENDEYQQRLTHEWYILNELMEELGIERISDNEAYTKYTRPLFMECREAENS